MENFTQQVKNQIVKEYLSEKAERALNRYSDEVCPQTLGAYLTVLLERAEFECSQQLLEEAERTYRYIKMMSEQMNRFDTRYELAVSLMGLAEVSGLRKNTEKASSYYRQACELARLLAAETETRKDYELYSLTLERLADLTAQAGKTEDARELLTNRLTVLQHLDSVGARGSTQQDLLVCARKCIACCEQLNAVEATKPYYEAQLPLLKRLIAETEELSQTEGATEEDYEAELINYRRELRAVYEQLATLTWTQENASQETKHQIVCTDPKEITNEEDKENEMMQNNTERTIRFCGFDENSKVSEFREKLSTLEGAEEVHAYRPAGTVPRGSKPKFDALCAILLGTYYDPNYIEITYPCKHYGPWHQNLGNQTVGDRKLCNKMRTFFEQEISPDMTFGEVYEKLFAWDGWGVDKQGNSLKYGLLEFFRDGAAVPMIG